MKNLCIRTLVPLALCLTLRPVVAQSGPLPQTVKKTFNIAPGETEQVRNRNYHRIDIRSEYAVKVLAGRCRAKSTFQWTCRFDSPWDLILTDLRPGTRDVNARANVVSVTLSDPDIPQDQPAAPSDPPSPPTQDTAAQPHQEVRSWQLQRGERVTVQNVAWPDLEIHSDGPISVSVGECFSPFTFKIECHGQIADIVIQDKSNPNRIGPNLVVMTATRP
jgi:hypothetical protein